MVPSITSVNTIADPKQVSSESSGSRSELLPKLETCSTANVAS
jgi:hypothetical protein